MSILTQIGKMRYSSTAVQTPNKFPSISSIYGTFPHISGCGSLVVQPSGAFSHSKVKTPPVGCTPEGRSFGSALSFDATPMGHRLAPNPNGDPVGAAFKQVGSCQCENFCFG